MNVEFGRLLLSCPEGPLSSPVLALVGAISLCIDGKQGIVWGESCESLLSFVSA